MNRDDADSVEDTEIVVEVVPTTGGSFEIKLDATATVEELRWRVARKVQTPRERLTLLSRERVLKTGRLDELEIRDGSRITLIPQLEAGFSTGQQGTEQSVVQAIEQLSEQQVDDFLSGRSPLTLALRVEDHMMFVQLQLEQSERKRRSAKRQSREKVDSADPKIARTQPTATSCAPKVSLPKVEKPSMSRLPKQTPPPNATIPGPSSRHPGLTPPVLSPEEWTRYRAELHRFHQMILPGHQPNCIVYPHQMVSEFAKPCRRAAAAIGSPPPPANAPSDGCGSCCSPSRHRGPNRQASWIASSFFSKPNSKQTQPNRLSFITQDAVDHSISVGQEITLDTISNCYLKVYPNPSTIAPFNST
ncbi:unnamed protein product [Oikopleura dioica]|uniref:Ubiquitin-like domain-containing protein n=1 Tax=Oikopleura dioica TaxID=34765 RepID=E4WV41_OIKDI|nr:unnamed protein product [Oikopleura dioica]